jgi:hypothetical protein
MRPASERPTSERNTLADRPVGRSVGLSKLNSMRPATLASGLSSRVDIDSRRVLLQSHDAEAPEPRPMRTRRLQGRLRC